MRIGVMGSRGQVAASPDGVEIDTQAAAFLNGKTS